MNGFIDAEGKALAQQRFMEQLPVRRLAINAELIVPMPWNPSAVGDPDWTQATEVEPAPDEPCTKEVCCHGCVLEAEGWTRGITFNGQDGEGPCECEHHEAYDVLGTWKLQAVLA